MRLILNGSPYKVVEAQGDATDNQPSLPPSPHCPVGVGVVGRLRGVVNDQVVHVTGFSAQDDPRVGLHVDQG
jgi:hypothetical protein